MNPYFSIIIPTFNSSKTIKSAIKSIIEQSYVNYEVLVIDAVSTDDTLDIIASFDDERIRIYSEPDSGIYDAMNKGIVLSKGEWLYFLGSDDVLYDNKVLEDVVSYVDMTELDVVYGNVKMTPSNNIHNGEFTPESMLQTQFCHQSIFYKRKVFHDIGYYNTKYKALADHDLNIKWFFSKKIKSQYIERIIAIYHEDGFSAHYKDSIFYDELYKKLIRHGLLTYSYLKLKELSIDIALQEKQQKKYFNYCFYLVLYYSFRFLDKVKRLMHADKDVSKK